MAEWCPTISGTYTAYAPQWRDKGKWQRILTVDSVEGVPQPARHGPVNTMLALFGYEQAQALAWSFSAMVAAERGHVEVRVQPFEVIYDIKARAIEAPMNDVEDAP